MGLSKVERAKALGALETLEALEAVEASWAELEGGKDQFIWKQLILLTARVPFHCLSTAFPLYPCLLPLHTQYSRVVEGPPRSTVK